MAEMLSPGVFIEEIDASSIVPSVSMSVATFGGEFTKGPTGSYMLITSVDDLIDFMVYLLIRIIINGISAITSFSMVIHFMCHVLLTKALKMLRLKLVRKSLFQ